MTAPRPFQTKVWRCPAHRRSIPGKARPRHPHTGLAHGVFLQPCHSHHPWPRGKQYYVVQGSRAPLNIVICGGGQASDFSHPLAFSRIGVRQGYKRPVRPTAPQCWTHPALAMLSHRLDRTLRNSRARWRIHIVLASPRRIPSIGSMQQAAGKLVFPGPIPRRTKSFTLSKYSYYIIRGQGRVLISLIAP